eukprot:sb/3467773/
MRENDVKEISLVSVTGRVSSIEGGGDLPSKYLDNVRGVMVENRTIEHKKEWSAFLQKWEDDEHVISVVRKHTHFVLNDGVNSVRVLGAPQSHLDPLQVVYDKFEPVEERNAVGDLFSFIVGSRLKGHQYVERMLPVNTILTAVGTVKLSDNSFVIEPPTSSPYILSRQTLPEVLQDLKDATWTPKVAMVIFGGISLSVLGYMGWKQLCRWKEKRRRERLVEEMERMRENGGSQSECCVVCLDNPRGVVLIPCGHVCMCILCADNMDTCPVCRGQIEQIVRTFNA